MYLHAQDRIHTDQNKWKKKSVFGFHQGACRARLKTAWMYFSLKNIILRIS